MSRHLLRCACEGRELVVVAGYDRPLRELYLRVVRETDTLPQQGEETVYDSLGESGLDWTDINTLADKLAALGIEPPASLMDGIFLDQCFNAGNRIVEHHIDRPPVVLHAG
ncbi:hypothetical protein [Paracidovorax anthurii]|uniref:Uncharacterized protein n=1 Tax=Paracidovorax anthurii TaxID=78229 RepID=A0A328YBD9_9BURK|nr:hypothetical protein [Paracidovorax anthurii]RAR71259.1 hypothetical protein AX018_11032 [Paracidovorax anthurii]